MFGGRRLLCTFGMIFVAFQNVVDFLFTFRSIVDQLLQIISNIDRVTADGVTHMPATLKLPTIIIIDIDKC